MSKASFYHIPVRTWETRAPRLRVTGVAATRPAPNHAPQFKRNRPPSPLRIALARLGKSR